MHGWLNINGSQSLTNPHHHHQLIGYYSQENIHWQPIILPHSITMVTDPCTLCPGLEIGSIPHEQFAPLLFSTAVKIKKPIKTKFRMPVFNWEALKPNQINGTVFNEIDDERILEVTPSFWHSYAYFRCSSEFYFHKKCKKKKLIQRTILYRRLVKASRGSGTKTAD